MSRTIVVTGAASGIGKATVALLRAADVYVIGVDLHGTDICADLSTEAGRAAMIEAVRAKVGNRLDGVVACAGLALAEPLTIAVNYFGAVATLEGLRPILEKGDEPRAVVVSSFAATMPTDPGLVEACLSGDEWAALEIAEGKDQLIYASSKVALTRWVRRHAITPEWAGKGILLNAVGPGLIQTPMTQAMIDDPTTMENLERLLPMAVGRYAQPEEVAALLKFMVSPENSYMVGQMVFIDGGSEATTRGDLAW